MNSLKYKNELVLIKEQNIDIANFESQFDQFKSSFGRNFELFLEKLQLAIKEIDKSIDHLQKTKNALISSDQNLILANDNAQDVTIRKLTIGNHPMVIKFEELKNHNSTDS